MQYTIQNGILHRDGYPIFALGTSYYPSYHKKKVSVPEDGDRIGEMQKDIQRMADAGLHLVRCASLGDVWYDEHSQVQIDTPFIDAMIHRAEECGLGVMVRLQGYSMNLSGWEDARMLDSKGQPMDGRNWWDFIQNSLFHEGIVRDNDAGTKALAEHFAAMPGVVGFQTYNEPHYPTDDIYDYHPDTIRAFREWLCTYMPREDAMQVDPPRERPIRKDDDGRMWVLWRLFSMQAMSDFLNHCFDVAKDATGREGMTCLTTCPTNASNAARGVNFFDNAARMDALGITQYYQITKPEAYLANMNLDLAESAASVYGKPLWLVEYDARTDIPLPIFRRLNYLALGAGVKGILHYQWRGDHIFPDSPEGNGFGFLNYDGTPTANFENALAVLSTINRLSDVLIHARKARSGVGILHSDYAYMMADAKDNHGTASRFEQLTNRHLAATRQIYTDARLTGISPDFLRARDLSTNPLGVRVLFVPAMSLLSEEEKTQIHAFAEAGGQVIEKIESSRYLATYCRMGTKLRKFYSHYDMEDMLTLCGIAPLVAMEAPSHYLHQTLVGDGYHVVVITNIENLAHAPTDIHLRPTFPVRTAEMHVFGESDARPLSVENGAVTLPSVGDGAIVLLR